MKKVNYFISICLMFFFIQIQARTYSGQKQQFVEKGFQSVKKVYDKDLIVNLLDEHEDIMVCAHPEKNGAFHFLGLPDGRYRIKVVNTNGLQSEAYYVQCSGGEIKNNLNEVITLSNMVPARSCIEGCSCERKSDLKLNITASPLKDKGDMEFTVNKPTDAQIIIANESGNPICTLPIGRVESGLQFISFDVSNLYGNYYYITAQAGTQSGTCKVKMH